MHAWYGGHDDDGHRKWLPREREPRLAKRVSLSDPLPYPNEVHEDGRERGRARQAAPFALGSLAHRAELYVGM